MRINKRWLVYISIILIVLLVGFRLHRNYMHQQKFVSEEPAVMFEINGEIIYMCMPDYLMGVMGYLLNGDEQIENIRAQVVIARTMIVSHASAADYIDARQSDLKWMEASEMRKKWGVKNKKIRNYILQAIKETSGQVILYEGKCIMPAIFKSGTGKTRCAKDVFGMDIPWLQSVDSDYEVIRQQIKLKEDVFYGHIKWILPKLDKKELEKNCRILKKDQAGYVISVQLGEYVISGELFQQLFKLPSAAFNFAFESSEVLIEVAGEGAGMGYDQLGADWLAKEGNNYEELLHYYFNGTTIWQ